MVRRRMTSMETRRQCESKELSVTVAYKCSTCGIHDRHIAVRARGGKEDVSAWMNTLIASVGDDHRKTSPHCRAKSLDWVKVHLSGARVGDPVKN